MCVVYVRNVSVTTLYWPCVPICVCMCVLYWFTAWRVRSQSNKWNEYGPRIHQMCVCVCVCLYLLLGNPGKVEPSRWTALVFVLIVLSSLVSLFGARFGRIAALPFPSIAETPCGRMPFNRAQWKVVVLTEITRRDVNKMRTPKRPHGWGGSDKVKENMNRARWKVVVLTKMTLMRLEPPFSEWSLINSSTITRRDVNKIRTAWKTHGSGGSDGVKENMNRATLRNDIWRIRTRDSLVVPWSEYE